MVELEANANAHELMENFIVNLVYEYVCARIFKWII